MESSRPLRRANALLFEIAPACLVVAVAALLGAAIAWRAFGTAYLLGTSDFWSYPAGDAAMSMTGWNFYVHDDWHWPIGTTHQTNEPTGASIIYFDAIPLVAFVGKLLVPILGHSFHPFGLWHLAVYVLQGVFGALVARQLGLRGLLGGLGVAVLCLSMSCFLLRFYHADLNGQFVILWALLNYLRTTREAPARSLAVAWAACLGCTLLIHPYLAAMTMAIALAAHARLAKCDWRRASLSFGTMVGALAAAWVIFGYVFTVPTAGEASAFGKASLNVMSLAVPFHSALIPPFSPPGMQDATGLQWDGQNFLGIGVLALFATTLVAARSTLGPLVRRHKLLLVALLVLAVYSLGPRWYVGRLLVLEYEVGGDLLDALATFRSTGRFFWPMGMPLPLALP